MKAVDSPARTDSAAPVTTSRSTAGSHTSTVAVPDSPPTVAVTVRRPGRSALQVACSQEPPSSANVACPVRSPARLSKRSKPSTVNACGRPARTRASCGETTRRATEAGVTRTSTVSVKVPAVAVTVCVPVRVRTQVEPVQEPASAGTVRVASDASPMVVPSASSASTDRETGSPACTGEPSCRSRIAVRSPGIRTRRVTATARFMESPG